MADDVLLNKAAIIERCVCRAREEYAKDPLAFPEDFTRQDAAILNIQRACQAAMDMGHHLIRRERLGLPQGGRDLFVLLARAGWISAPLANDMQGMVGFRNIAVHDYQTLLLPILIRILTERLDDLTRFAHTILSHDQAPSPS
ncbi:MAG: DUF86 domain-containing protein [Magnetococcales bacterium]|nr:DUF86 domain-containing protein [Magnetococcales bacterium]